MGKSLSEIAQELKNGKKTQLIYAFNGTGKTRLSKEFKILINGENNENLEGEEDQIKKQILYYNAFTEDLFYWDNDLENDEEPKLKIQPNSFIEWVLKDQGQDQSVISNFQRYTNNKLTPKFNPDFSEVTFSYESGNDEPSENIKISKGEESNFIWSIFYSLLLQVVGLLNENEGESELIDQLEYIFIDDPVSSLDDNHLIQLAVDIAELIKSSKYSGSSSKGLKFIITTHNPTFYNVLFNGLRKPKTYLLNLNEEGTLEFESEGGDSNKKFSYHLHIKNKIEEAIKMGKIERYHFMLLRNLYEKTASFLGFEKWKELLPKEEAREAYYERIIQFSSHSSLADEIVAELKDHEKQIVTHLLNHLINNYNYWKEVSTDV